MRVPVSVVDSSTLLCDLFNGIFALRRCLIVRLGSEMAMNDTSICFGGLGFGVGILRQHTQHLSRVFSRELLTVSISPFKEHV